MDGEREGMNDCKGGTPPLEAEEESISIIGFTVDIMAGSFARSSGFDKREERISGVADVGAADATVVSSCLGVLAAG